MAPLFTAVSSSARQLLLLLRCISFAKKALVRISPQGIRFTASEGSVMEAFVMLEKSLFTTYSYNPPAPDSSQDEPSDPPTFEISLVALLETLNIFGLSDPAATKRPGDYDAFAAHRLNRHAGINAFSNNALNMTGICTFTYAGEGEPLSIHMSESGVTTVCDLTTYEASSSEEIPFDRDSLALKTILRSPVLLDAISELNTLQPNTLSLHARPSSQAGPHLSLISSGNNNSAAVDFTANPVPLSDAPILETFHCPAPTSATFHFGPVKAAQRAMAAATKVSMRLDQDSVLSLQFLVEVEVAGGGAQTGEDAAVTFVDFRVVPLADGEAEDEDEETDEEEGVESE